MSPTGQAQVAQAIAQGTDSTSYRTVLMQALNKVVPPQDLDKDDKPIDKQKEAELSAKAGNLVLGVNMLTDLGSMEQEVTKQP